MPNTGPLPHGSRLRPHTGTACLGVMCLSSARAQAFDRMRPPLMMVYCVRLFTGY